MISLLTDTPVPPLNIEPRQPPDVTALAAVLDGVDAQLWDELWTPGRLPGETLAQFAARRDVAGHILDDLLAGVAAGFRVCSGSAVS